MKKICVIVPFFNSISVVSFARLVKRYFTGRIFRSTSLQSFHKRLKYYFTKWPRWFDFYLKTCEYNKDINWIFFTDCGKPKKEIKNVKFVEMSLKDFNSLAFKKLGLKVNVTEPYKLCDFKPAYGVIFEDHIRDYDFWAFGDIDLVYGNIRKFVTDSTLEKYDMISFRKEYISGSFALFKNTDNIKRLYEKSPDYKKVFESKKHFCFDECNFLGPYLRNGGSIFDGKSDLEKFNFEWNKEVGIISMTHVIKKLEDRGLINVLFKTLIQEHSSFEKFNFEWNNGRLTNLEIHEEVPYFHFPSSKNNENFSVPRLDRIPNIFNVTEKGFNLV